MVEIISHYTRTRLLPKACRQGRAVHVIYSLSSKMAQVDVYMDCHYFLVLGAFQCRQRTVDGNNFQDIHFNY
jgi:hypothetical protein